MKEQPSGARRAAIIVGILVGLTALAFALRNPPAPPAGLDPRTKAMNPEGSTPPSSEEPSLPELTLIGLDGKPEKIAFRGRSRLVVFWATWCQPCLEEIPDLKRFQETYAKQDFIINAFSIDDGGLEDVRPFAKSHGLNYPIHLANPEAVTAFGGIEGIPTSFLIDTRGRIVKRYVGYQNPDDVERDIRELLAAG